LSENDWKSVEKQGQGKEKNREVQWKEKAVEWEDKDDDDREVRAGQPEKEMGRGA
jgi:hypothetical protein